MVLGAHPMPTSQIWAPWRMPYILKTVTPEKSGGCFFCDDIAGAVASYRENLVVVVQEHAFVCLNRYPFQAGHLLVAPRRHVGDLTDLTDVEYGALMTLLRETARRLRAAVSCPAMNIGFNLGVYAGAGVADHVHGHIVPRWAGDTSFMPVLADVRVMPEYLDQTWARLYEAFADLPGDRAPAPQAGPEGSG
jgi:ATP adenylyltransferase